MSNDWYYDLTEDHRLTGACPEAQPEGTRRACWSGCVMNAPPGWRERCNSPARTPSATSHAGDVTNLLNTRKGQNNETVDESHPLQAAVPGQH